MAEMNKEGSIKLSDIIDFSFLQDFQDAFAKSTGVASITVDNEGPVTNPSNFTDFCIKYTRNSELGFNRCNQCDIKWGKRAAQKGKPIIYKCHSGLTDFAVPIFLNGKHVGSILGGQVLTKEPDEVHYRNIAKELGIDEDEYIDALRKIKIISAQQVKNIAQLLFLTANSISKIANKNFELIEKSKRDALLKKTIETVRSSLNPDEIKKYLIDIIGNYFDADRCLFAEYSTESNKFIFPGIKKLKSDGVKIFRLDNDEDDFPEFDEKLKKGRNIVIKDLEKTLSRINFSGYKSLENLKNNNVKSNYALVVKYKDKIMGLLAMHFVQKKRVLTSEEFDFLKVLCDQVGIALYQNRLYENEKKSTKREKLLRKIIQTITTTTDIDETLSVICTEVAKLFNVQRSIIVEYYDPENYSQYLVKKEYKSRSEIKSIKDIGHSESTAAYWGKSLLEDVDVLAFDNISIADVPDYFKNTYESIGAKSLIGAAVQKEGQKWGAIVLFDYDNYRHWTNEEKELLATISNQIYISIHQAELYSRTKQQAEREKAILNNLPFMAWLKDEHSRFLNVNAPYAENLKLPVEEILGKNDSDFYPAEIAQQYIKDDLEIMQTGKQINIEEKVVGADGVKWYETFKTPVLNEDGQVVGTTGFSRDITEQKEIDKMKNEFISIISHELRTPLTSIRGALGLISSNALGFLPDKVGGLLNIASNNTIRLINLINDILDLEKIKAGKMNFDFDEYEVMPLIEETIKLNEEYANQYSVKFEIKSRLENAFINVDKNRWIQVLTNLLSNAAKFSFNDEIVGIFVERKNDHISVSVTNSGPGIPEGAYSKLFESFSQVDSSDTRQKGGTGLGLCISKSIIQKMGGSIGFESKLNEFTTFYFDLPEIHKHNEYKTVLICEDNRTTAHCLKSMFENIGYVADIALCADHAITLLKNNNYDLMTLDLILPDKDGMILLNELRQEERTKDLPVLIISVAKPDIDFVKSNYKIIDWLEKSFDIKDLQQKINEIMHNKNRNKIEILHVENDDDILDLINITLNDLAFVTRVTNLTDAISSLESSSFDMIILDYVFPEGTSDKLIPIIKSGRNKNAKLIVFSAYEESKLLTPYVDDIILKTNVSNEEFKNCIEKFIVEKGN